jgi:glycerol-3-phosphate dehydrogenase (NAD(P)+)
MKLKAVPEPPPVACLGGPSIAAELAAKTPTAVDLATSEDGLARPLAGVLSTRRFVAHAVEDLRGLETCLAFKNIYAIALAWPAGLSANSPAGSMTNLKAILFLQVQDELEALVEAGGGNRRTARRFSGLGDLVATAEAGRNARFGRLLGGSQSAQAALDQMEKQGVQTIEGYEATRLGLKYVDSLGDLSLDHLPVLSAIHQVLYESGSVKDCIDRLDLNAIAQSLEIER